MLDAGERQELVLALMSALDAEGLVALLADELAIAVPADALPLPVGELAARYVDLAEGEGWTAELVGAAYRRHGRSPRLRHWHFRLAGVEAVPEGVVRAQNTLLPVAIWMSRLYTVTTRVCRIEFPAGTRKGTGFLVGPRAVLTCDHVITPLRKDAARAREVVARFDYHGGASGSAVALAGDWLVASSPVDPGDLRREPGTQPSLAHLDYALLRLERAVGDASLGRGVSPGSGRGWVLLSGAELPLGEGAPVVIVQHPDNEAMKFDDKGQLLKILPGGARLRYSTNTQAGSSGSPCFTQDLVPIALHHTGDGSKSPAWNEGIPLHLIRRDLENQGAQSELGGELPEAGADLFGAGADGRLVAAPGAAPSAQVSDALVALRAALAEPAVREAAMGFRADLVQVRAQKGRLEAWKTLHDVLHGIETGLLRPLRQAVRGLADADSRELLRHYASDLEDALEPLALAAAALAAEGERERVWIARLSESARAFSGAADAGDTGAAETAYRVTHVVLDRQPPLLNEKLLAAAAAIGLERLVLALATVRARADAAAVASAAVARIRAGAEALAAMAERLEAALGEHRAWQEIDTDLRYVEASELQHLADLWPQLGPKVARIAAVHAAGWAGALAAAVRALDGVAVSDPQGRRKAFDELRRLCRKRFVAVDRAVLALAQEVVTAVAPLDAVLEVLQ